MVEINYACEGRVDGAIAERLIRRAGGLVGIARPAGGKSKLDPKLPKYLNAAKHQGMKWVVLRDLDHDATCAAALCAALSVECDPSLCFRIVVREVESWLMADSHSMAAFLGVQERKLPTAPDDLDSPKDTIVSLARISRKRGVQEALIPRPKSGLSTGQEYASWMVDFANKHWDPDVAIASQRSPSLVKAAHRIKELVLF